MQNKPTFSIIIPSYNRFEALKRALLSSVNQSYDKELYEIIIIDDGSTDNTPDIVEFSNELKNSPSTKVIGLRENQGRLHARNIGMREARGDWICWLDSDDEYASNYLETLANAIQQFPEYSVFNFASIAFSPDNVSSIWDTFVPEVRPDGRGHVGFRSGRITTGGFIFKRELLQSVGFLPEAATPYGSDTSFPAIASQKYPEIRTFHGQNESGDWLPLGNPWGDDYYMFFALTRENLSKPLNLHINIKHLRP